MQKMLGAVAIIAAIGADASGARADSMDGAGWSGFYFGAQGGYAIGTAAWTNDPVFTGASNPRGGFGGGYAGYNFQNGNIVFGPEISAIFGSMGGSALQRSIFPGTAIVIRQDRSNIINWIGMMNARLGYDMNGWLPYVTGGLAVGGASATSSAFNETSGTLFSATIDTGSRTHVGYNIGLGVEKKVSKRVSIGVEYRYVDLGTQTYVFPVQGPRAVRLTTNLFAARVGFHF